MFAEFKIKGLPPTINNFYGRNVRNVYKKAKAREWQLESTNQIRNEWGKNPVLTSTLELQIKFISGSRRKWDMDNRIKALQDCLQDAGVIEDDAQIDSLIVRREYGKTDETHIIVTEYSNERS